MIPPCAANVSGVNILSSGNNIDAVLLFTLPVGLVSMFIVAGTTGEPTILTGVAILALANLEFEFGVKETSGVGAIILVFFSSMSSSFPTPST
jgi:hypothetical protein